LCVRKRNEAKEACELKISGNKISAFLCKWWWKLEKHDGLWLKIVRQKYMRNRKNYSLKMRSVDSPCWKNFLRVKEIYLSGRRVSF
jgi:hypothetical protein